MNDTKTQSLIRFGSDPTGGELRDEFLTSGLKSGFLSTGVFLFCNVDC